MSRDTRGVDIVAEPDERRRSVRASRLVLDGVASREPYTRGTVLTRLELPEERAGERLMIELFDLERRSEGVITVEREELELGVYVPELRERDPEREVDVLPVAEGAVDADRPV